MSFKVGDRVKDGKIRGTVIGKLEGRLANVFLGGGEYYYVEVDKPERIEKMENQCEFCNKADFSSFSARADKYLAKIFLAGGSGRFPKDEQFNFCPVCGRGLKTKPKQFTLTQATAKLSELLGEDVEIVGCGDIK